jgi:hypothetical protein
VCERFLAIDVFARADGCHCGDCMYVVWRADRNGIDVLRLFIEQEPKILRSPRAGKSLKRAGGSFVVNVTQGHDIGS